MTTLIVDVGSSSVRVLLLDAAFQVLPGAVSRRNYSFTYDADGAAEIDPVQLRLWVEACIDEVLLHPAAQTISAVGMTTFVGNLLGVDAQNAPLTPVYTYADTRAADYIDPLRAALDTEAAYARTGCPHHVAYHPSKLRWLQATSPDKTVRVTQWLDFATYCYRTWFAREVPCSYSIASWSGLLNRHTLAWDEAWLAALALTPNRLPPLADFDAQQVGLSPVYHTRWSLLAQVPFYLAIGDGAAANIGSGGGDAGQLVLTVGTTAALRVVTEAKNPTLPRGLWHYRVSAGRHLVGGATTEGGNIYSWAKQTLQLDVVALDDDLLMRPADVHGLTLLPTFAGERSPGFAPDAVGVIYGLRLSTTPLDIAQACLEAVALRLAVIADALSTEALPIYAGGGALNGSKAWGQIIANALGRTVYLLDEPEITARGVAILISGRLADAPKPAVQRVYRPDSAATAALKVARQRQTALYEQFFGKK